VRFSPIPSTREAPPKNVAYPMAAVIASAVTRRRVALLSANRMLAILCLVPFLPSCSSDTEFRAALDAAAATYRGAALARELESLDRRFPDRLELKTDLGALYLASGDLARAASQLERGEVLAEESRDDGLLYLLYANLAELRLRSRSFEASIAAADSALASARRSKAGDRVGVDFVKAKALAALGKKDAALAIFDAAKIGESRTMTEEDMKIHVRLLAEKGRFADALARTKERRARFGYAAGTGLEESILYERLGRLPEAAASAFEELDRRRFHAGLADSAVLAGLAEAKKRLAAPSPREGIAVTAAVAVLTGAELFTRGDFTAASAVFASVVRAEGESYLDFLAAACDAEAGKAGSVERLVALESRYGNFQGFYYHLWRAMKKRESGYSFGTARSVLETCILLAPGSAVARETRGELGILAGIGAEDGRKILLGPELDALGAALVGGAGPEVLDPAVELLATKDSTYRLAAQILLRKAASLPAVRSRLEKRKAEAAGRLREGLAAVL